MKKRRLAIGDVYLVENRKLAPDLQYTFEVLARVRDADGVKAVLAKHLPHDRTFDSDQMIVVNEYGVSADDGFLGVWRIVEASRAASRFNMTG